MAEDIAGVLPGLAWRQGISDMLHRTAARLPGKPAIISRNTGLTFAEPEAAVSEDGSWDLHGGDEMTPHPGAAQATCSPGIGRATGRVLVVGNDSTISSLISRALAAAGYMTDLASTGTEGLRRARECHYDLIILDLVTGDLDGPLAWGRIRIREQAHPHGEVITLGQLSLDLGRLAADTGHGPVPLTRLEFLVLRELAEHAGQPVPKSELLSTVWGYEFDPGSNVVDVCVRRLRSKLGFGLIKTVRGEGYQLAGQLPACGAAAAGAASREVIEDDLPLTDALQVPIDQLGAEARERARPERPGQLGYPGPRARSTPWISARHGAVNAIPADCRMPW